MAIHLGAGTWTRCSGAGEVTTDIDTADCGECLFFLVSELLEGKGGELEALQAARRLAELANPELEITVITGPRVPTIQEYAYTLPEKRWQ